MTIMNPCNNSAKKTACPVCSHSMEFLYTIDRFSNPFDIFVCPECGLQKKHSANEDENIYYGEDYYSGRAEYSYIDERKFIPYHRHVWKARLKNIARYVAPPSDFLDIGCAFGGFALEAKQMGYRAKGLDISDYAVQYAVKSGLDAKAGKLEDIPFPENSFDIVTMIEVIEHVSDPKKAFHILSDMIRPGGLLILQTANFEGLQAKHKKSDYHYYLPGHLHYYSKSNLEKILKRFGFSRTIFYGGVDFGLMPKLLKSGGGFYKPSDYLKWIQMAVYHYKSKIRWNHFAMTSSMVMYAFRDKK